MNIRPLRLFDLSRANTSHGSFELSEVEQQHLRGCEQCRSVLAVFSRQFAKPPNEKPEDAA